MLASLKRGDTYRRRGEFAAALRDLGQAAFLDPAAPRPIELLGDVQAAMGQYDAAASRIPAISRHRRPRTGGPVQAGARPLSQRDGRRARRIRFAGPSPSTTASPKPTTCSASPCARPIAIRRCARCAGRWRSTRRSRPHARSWLACTKTWAARRTRSIELEALAALEPTRPERLVNVGLAYARIGRRDTAVLTLGRAAERHPEATVVYTALGRIWLTSAEAQKDPVALGKAIEALQPAAAQAGRRQRNARAVRARAGALGQHGRRRTHVAAGRGD